MNALTNLFNRRKSRVRRTLKSNSTGRARLSVHRSSKHIYVQVIDDAEGKTLAAASTLEKDLKTALKTGADKAAAAAVGKLIAERAIKAGVKDVVFDRGGYIYHGRVKALADAAREGGLNFSAKRIASWHVPQEETAAAGIAKSAIASSPRSWCTSTASPRW